MLFNIDLATPVALPNLTIIVEFAAKPKSDSYVKTEANLVLGCGSSRRISRENRSQQEDLLLRDCRHQQLQKSQWRDRRNPQKRLQVYIPDKLSDSSGPAQRSFLRRTVRHSRGRRIP